MSPKVQWAPPLPSRLKVQYQMAGCTSRAMVLMIFTYIYICGTHECENESLEHQLLLIMILMVISTIILL